MAAGLVALVVFSDPTFTRLAWADALAVLVAGGVIAAALAPIDWDRLPRLTIAAPIVLGLLLALGATFTQGSALAPAAAAAGVLVIVAIYAVPWDGLPRWVHELPVFGGIGAVFVIQATVHPPGFGLAAVLLVFPLYLTTVLFAALYHTRNEVWAATALASIGILVLSVTGGPKPGQPAISILVVAVLWVVVLTVHSVVRRSEALTAQLVQLVGEKTAGNVELTEQKRLLESLLQNLSDMGIGLVISTGSTIEFVNDAISRMTGHGRGPGQFPQLTDIFTPESMDQFRMQLAARATGMGGVVVQEWEIIASDGRRVPIESISRSEMVDGKPHSVAMVLDITERKRAERALAESQARLQAIVDTSLNAIVGMDETGQVTDWNPYAETTFGWSRDEILGRALADTIIPPQHRDAHRAGLARYLETGEGPVLGKVLELTALAKDGREFPVELAISRASTPGAKALFVAFVRDITRRKEAERAINDLNAELKVANQHKSEFLANMSHELRTPLNAILGFSELMLDDTTGKYNPATRHKFLSQINTSGRHLLDLINDILDLSKVEAGQMMLELEMVSLSNTVAQVMDTIEPIASKKGVRVEARKGETIELEADAGKLTQMLLNLVSNAVKFTPEGGTVTIQVQRLSTTVEISVTDTGIGIAASDLDRLFKEFQQLDAGAGRHQEGTGLGLALTQRLAALHGGSVDVVSELAKGSVFTIRLPLRSPTSPLGAKQSESDDGKGAAGASRAENGA